MKELTVRDLCLIRLILSEKAMDLLKPGSPRLHWVTGRALEELERLSDLLDQMIEEREE